LNAQEQLIVRRNLLPSDDQHGPVVEWPNLRGAVHALERIEMNRHFWVIKLSAENYFGALCPGPRRLRRRPEQPQSQAFAWRGHAQGTRARNGQTPTLDPPRRQ
jgi:hypothetical protein